ncbi:MAG: hypothetical protein ACJAQ4_000916 [Cryomorphaceae bacterium]|jgi:hypothetical protein
MANYQVRSKSVAEARSFFQRAGDKVWQIRTKSNKICPHLTITFCSNLSLADLNIVISELSNDKMMKSSLRKDLREVHLV